MSSATLGADAARRGIDEIEAARRLAEALDNGGWLRPITVEDAPLGPGEEAYADLSVHGWRYHAIDVQYEHRTVAFGGPFLFAVTGLASLVANRRRRHEAERLAAPQWRPLGLLRVLVTSRRLLVQREGAWYSVWYEAVTDVASTPASVMLDLTFVTDPPYRLVGPGLCSLVPLLVNSTPRFPATASAQA
jgi:hypothetical protein